MTQNTYKFNLPPIGGSRDLLPDLGLAEASVQPATTGLSDINFNTDQYSIDNILGNSTGLNLGGGGPKQSSFLGDLFKDKHMASGLAGLFGVGLQAAALPSQLRTSRLQQEALKKNIAAFDADRADHSRRSRNFEDVAGRPRTSTLA